jgi:hypothetical protein
METKDYITIGISLLIVMISIIGAILSFYFSRKAKEHSDIILVNGFIDQATREFERKGSAKHYIESLILADDKKEMIWRQSHFRYKGRYPDRRFSDMPATVTALNLSIGEYKPIMEAVGSGQYEDRTAKSLSKETGMDVEYVQKGLSWFFENGLVQKRTADDGTFWCLTDRGWKVHRDIQKTKPSQETKAGGN